MKVRAALAEETHAISDLCLRSKAHWGYDEAFMALARPTLIVKAEQIVAGDVWVAESQGRIAGMVALAKLDDPTIVDLDKLFVEPAQIGTGAGRALMAVAIAEARRRGYARMAILSDPHAAAFYEKLGARFIDERASDAIPGRLLPYFELTL